MHHYECVHVYMCVRVRLFFLLTHCTGCTCCVEDDEKVTYIAVGVSCGVLLGLVVGMMATVLVVVVMKKMHTSHCDKGQWQCV